MSTVNVVLTRERRWENMSWEDHFVITNSDDESEFGVERLLRDAIDAYLATPEGVQSIEDSSRDFNWGDVMMDISDEFWGRYGIKVVGGIDEFIPGTLVYITVNQDEVLFDD